jgi:hypothetical protein
VQFEDSQMQATVLPLTAQVSCAAHAAAVPHEPVELHVSMPLPEHCFVPGLQAAQAPPPEPVRHTGADPLHVVVAS